MPTVSKRGMEVPLSPFRKLVPYADAAKARGVKVYHLNIGQPDIPTPDFAIQKLKETELEVLAYSPAVGNASYREKLVGYYQRFGIEVTADNIIITTGASEAIQMMLFACLDAGDEIILPEPFYANYNGFAQIANVGIKSISCYIENGFQLPSIEKFEAIIGPKTKAIFITNPNNPTGCFYKKEALQELAALIKKHDLYLFVDEVYREFCFDGNEFFSTLNLAGVEDKVIVFDSISKRYSACGARVGAIVCRNEAVIETFTRYAKLRLSPPGLGQILSEHILEADEAYIEWVKEEYDKRRTLVYERLKKMPGVLSYKPGGAFYCFARFPVQSAEHFCQWLLEEFSYKGETIMLSPGEGFYASPGRGVNEVRLAFVLNTNELSKAMDCLEQAIMVYPGRVKENEVQNVLV